MKQILLVASSLIALMSCSENQADNMTVIPSSDAVVPLKVTGQWIVDGDGRVMTDPQTSGLTLHDGSLYTISDGSAVAHQQRKFHVVDPTSARVSSSASAFSVSARVRRSCFYQYLQNEPDLEALVADPAASNIFYSVTEDATRTGALSMRCQSKYENTGSTDYPTLLLRLRKDDDGSVTLTHARPVQFPLAFEVGDFPNDGIEGMALSDDGILYLGLEKDAAGQPRIFSVALNDDFWSSDEFATVEDAKLPLPVFTSGNHPVNGLAWYRHPDTQRAYLLAAARNDNEVWVVATDGQGETHRVPMQFMAPTNSPSGQCEPFEIMDNASIEGLVVASNTLYLINDPWKKNYLKNIRCESNRAAYEAMAPLLFATPLLPEWFN